VAGNQAHCDDMVQTLHHPFVPGSPYYEYFPQNKNFEDYCVRSAFFGQPLHSYVELPQMGLWLNMYLNPLRSEEENIGYCLYTYEVTPGSDSEQRANVSAETSAAVLQTCIKLRGSNNKRETFKEVIEDIREICDSDHCCILITDDEKKTCCNLCEAIRKGSNRESIEEYLKYGFYEITKTWPGTIGDSTCVILKDERDMEWLKSINPLWHESLSYAGVNSIVLFPLKYNDRIFGYMWALNFNINDTVMIKETLELTSFFIAAEIENYMLLQRLEVLSSIDMLTGAKNRNKMNAFVDDVVNGRVEVKKPYSVVFADLNGLKNVNDEHGHGAGDEILKKAADILKETFPDGDVYRAGGDEFMIIVPGMDETEVEARSRKIKELAESQEDLFFAIGTHVVRDNEDIRTAMRNADQGMYSDKRAYYATHPDRRAR
ncbi:MAG: sensor domain-containing diguanylate cyclase, partial [Lachnospiraceae bacterium]|nr:sensor domain-containing diguanylate cyclase [Lachnospiraceae bacterium]